MAKVKHKDARKLIKRNEFQELIKNVIDYTTKNTENVIIMSVIALIVIISIPLFIKYRVGNEMKAEELLSRANYYVSRPVMDTENATMFGMFRTNEEKYDQVQNAYMEVVQKYKGTKAAAYAYLGIANAYYNSGKYTEALEYYNSFIEKYPRHTLVSDALSGVGYCNYQLGNFEDAKKAWSNTEAFKGQANYYDVKLRLADSYIKLNDKANAEKILNEVIKEAPESYWSETAMAELKELK